MIKLLEEIQKLSLEEQLLIARTILENAEPKEYVFEPSSHDKAWMDARIDSHLKNPSEGFSWAEVKARALASL
jgi:putative addiction module component (TIGR02574 family)